jgi:hypothetical protein
LLDWLTVCTRVEPSTWVTARRPCSSGGIAVFQLSESARQPALARSYQDFDVVVPPGQGQAAAAAAAAVFRERGYAEDAHFNALHGAHRMIFTASGGFVVDVLIGTFQMCHQLRLGHDLPGSGLTVYPADLMLTKLRSCRSRRRTYSMPPRS